MAWLGNFLKSFNTRILLSTRLPQISQECGLKRKSADILSNLGIPEKPKKPLSPYMRFMKEHRKEVVQKYPNWKITQIAAQCGADWKLLPASEKEKYEIGFRDEMDHYSDEFLKYNDSLTDEQKKAISVEATKVKKQKQLKAKRKLLKENEKPKKPVGAYLLYVKEQVAKQPEKTYIELVAALKEDWNKMPDGEKVLYTKPAEDAMRNYEEQLVQWENKMLAEGKKELVRQSTLISKPKKRTEESQVIKSVDRVDSSTVDSKKPNILTKFKEFFTV